ncbi:hypothetical protein HD841_001333 [Sphingomonas melonis]|uniref:Uncharacterized protein n=1 Tax=Sphingomonas melonis TaxID=152682 RepID=A0A7Y9FLQ7_9SPHN|nr:hypothetical protein [Sphingomonas melonis]
MELHSATRAPRSPPTPSPRTCSGVHSAARRRACFDAMLLRLGGPRNESGVTDLMRKPIEPHPRSDLRLLHAQGKGAVRCQPKERVKLHSATPAPRSPPTPLPRPPRHPGLVPGSTPRRGGGHVSTPCSCGWVDPGTSPGDESDEEAVRSSFPLPYAIARYARGRRQPNGGGEERMEPHSATPAPAPRHGFAAPPRRASHAPITTPNDRRHPTRHAAPRKAQDARNACTACTRAAKRIA